MIDLVVLTGAGVSAESGLATFRDAGGLWEGQRPEDVATPQAFARDPDLVHRFYNARRAAAGEATPNAAHSALAALQDRLGERMLLVTQNVDGLHEAAGHRGVIHMHGALNRATCGACGHRWAAPAVMETDDPCPSCGAPATRPDIVWFGEMPQEMERIYKALDAAHVFAAIGTSGLVYPAAGFVDVAASAGVLCHEINLAPGGNPTFHQLFSGPATQAVPSWCADVEALLG
ncbi:MAG: NAD-dependent deacylase [Rhodobacteraceae bacterium]|nr:NAD-dependent deacylase [Paracoccaceae bacterium]